MRVPLPALVLPLLATLDGCAGVACTASAIVVAATDERTLLQSEPRGLRTDELGRVKEQRREVLVPEYWVQDVEGRWYRVSESVWRGAAPGQVVQVCR
jgi:hypothetical protein